MNYTFDESKAILRHPAVHAVMSRVVHGCEIAPPQTPPWHYDGRDNPTSPFVLFGLCVERAVYEAIRTTPPGRERERLLLLLNITETHEAPAVSKAVGRTCEDYAVQMQFGDAGLRSYTQFAKRV